MSDADPTRISVVEEMTFATLKTDPALHALNFTAADLRMQTGKVQSRLIRPDAQMIRGTKVSESAVGRIDGELQYDITGAFFKLLKASMRSAAETAATATVTGVSYALNGGLHELSGTGVGTGVGRQPLVPGLHADLPEAGVAPRNCPSARGGDAAMPRFRLR